MCDQLQRPTNPRIEPGAHAQTAPCNVFCFVNSLDDDEGIGVRYILFILPKQKGIRSPPIPLYREMNEYKSRAKCKHAALVCVYILGAPFLLNSHLNFDREGHFEDFALMNSFVTLPWQIDDEDYDHEPSPLPLGDCASPVSQLQHLHGC